MKQVQVIKYHHFFQFIFFIFILFYFPRCKTIQQTSSSVVSDTTKNISEKIKIQHDSIYLFKHDSIFIRAKNDTVFVEKWLTDIQRYIHYDTIHQIDTVYRSRGEETIITKTKTVEKTKYVKWLFWLGLAIPVLFFGIWKFIKFYFKLS